VDVAKRIETVASKSVKLASKSMEHEGNIGRLRPSLVTTSKRLFGKQHRLEIASVCGVLEPPVWSRRVSQLLGLAENQVAAELNAFVELGALQRLPLSEFDRRKTYQAAAVPFWDFCRVEFERAVHRDFADEGNKMLMDYWTYVTRGHDQRAAVGEGD
jgi:hypothetical protein